MKKIKSDDKYDYYVGDNLYNIVPVGSPAPEGGYFSPNYIIAIKGIARPELKEEDALKYFESVSL